MAWRATMNDSVYEVVVLESRTATYLVQASSLEEAEEMELPDEPIGAKNYTSTVLSIHLESDDE